MDFTNVRYGASRLVFHNVTRLSLIVAQLCSAILTELDARYPELSLRMWASGSSHMRTLVDGTAAALLQVRFAAVCTSLCCLLHYTVNLQVPAFSAGYVVLRGNYLLLRRCQRALGSNVGGVLTVDAVQAGIASATAVADIVSASSEWEAILESTRSAAAVAALARRNALLRHFNDEPATAAELVDPLTGRQATSASDHSGIARMAAIESAESPAHWQSDSALLGGIGMHVASAVGDASGTSAARQPLDLQLHRLDRIASNT